jgi:ribosomal protein L16/L10AE
MLKKGDILLEIRSFDNNFARKILIMARLKLNIKTQINERSFR